jgi:hypothetical protein
MNKRKINEKYYHDNYEELKELYGGNNIIIVNETVIFAGLDFDEWCKKWDFLSFEEQHEAHSTYIPSINAPTVICCGTPIPRLY